MLHIKRVYEPPSPKDGYRVLVDRLWPRGMKKETAAIDYWLKEVAPTTELRQWFHHDTTKWSSFREKYRKELAGNEAVAALEAILQKHRTVTLLYGARDEAHNHAKVLKEYFAV